MKKKTKKIKNAGYGFVMIFTVTISSILLAIALGVANIAVKEMKFGTNARDTNEAFFAADTGAEYALYEDKSPGGVCTPDPTCGWSGVMVDLGGSGLACAKVTVDKTSTLTTVISKGYNMGDSSCDSTNPDRIERQLKVTY